VDAIADEIRQAVAEEQTHRLVLEAEAHELRESLGRAERRIDNSLAGTADERESYERSILALERERDDAQAQRDRLSATFEAQSEDLDRLNDKLTHAYETIDTVAGERDEAMSYARNLIRSLYPELALLDTIGGRLTQIDSIMAGLVEQRDELTAALRSAGTAALNMAHVLQHEIRPALAALDAQEKKP
jgi:chromosome segregation ATPase